MCFVDRKAIGGPLKFNKPYLVPTKVSLPNFCIYKNKNENIPIPSIIEWLLKAYNLPEFADQSHLSDMQRRFEAVI